MLLLVVLLAGTTLAACGGGGDDGDLAADDVATLDEDGTGDDEQDDDGGDGDDEVTEEEREEAMLAFTQCMRDHGVEMPDPETGGDGERSKVVLGSDMGTPEEIEAAQKACEHIMTDAFGEPQEMDPEEEAEMRDQMLDFAACMRDHGIDMPDPEFDDGGGVRMRVGEPGEANGIDPESEEFQAADETCRDEVGMDDEGGFGSSGPGKSEGGS